MANLKQRLTQYDKSIEKVVPQYSAKLGKTPTVVSHPTRNGFCYARMADNLDELIVVFNDQVSQVYDLPILVSRRGNTWYVVGRDTQRYVDWGTSASYLPIHHRQHEFNRDEGTGADTVFVYPDQFMPLLVYPSGTNGASNLMVAPYLLQRTNDFVYVGNTGTTNLLIYKPTDNQAIMGLVVLNKTTGNPEILIGSGTPFNATLTGTSAISPYIPYPSSNQEPLYAFRLVSGTTSVIWPNLYNARQFIGGNTSTSTGSSSGLPLFITGSIPFSGADGILTEDNFGLRYDTTFGQIKMGNPKLNAGIAGIVQSADGFVQHILEAYSDSLGDEPVIKGAAGGGIRDAITPALTGKILLSIRGAGADDVDHLASSSSFITLEAAEDFTTSQHGTLARIRVTETGTTSTTHDVVVQNDGNVDILSPSGTYNVMGIPHTHAGGASSIPILTSDPVLPGDGYTYYLRETSGVIANGLPIGLLLALTYTGATGSVIPLQLSVWDDVTSQIIRF